MSQEYYQQLLNSQLNPAEFDERQRFPHDDILGKLGKILERTSFPPRMKRIIYQKAVEKKDASPFYILPKIHKPTIKARPITAQHSYCLSHLSGELSKLLNKEVAKIPAITTSSKQFVRQLESMRFPKNSVLLTYDIVNCYPSLNTNHMCAVLTEAFPHIFQPKPVLLEQVITTDHGQQLCGMQWEDIQTTQGHCNWYSSSSSLNQPIPLDHLQTYRIITNFRTYHPETIHRWWVRSRDWPRAWPQISGRIGTPYRTEDWIEDNHNYLKYRSCIPRCPSIQRQKMETREPLWPGYFHETNQ